MVEERLAACVNILGTIRSIYRWQGEIEDSEEVAALFKTGHSQADTLIARIADLHSYDVPCIESWPVDRILGSYAEWVEGEVR
jgi:periplasmic divalent cation tolerance protein